MTNIRFSVKLFLEIFFKIFKLYDCSPVNKSVEGEVRIGNFATSTCNLQLWQAGSHIRRVHKTSVKREKRCRLCFRRNQHVDC